MNLEKTLRALIYEVAEANEAIGTLEESLKWGQPSFTPKKRNVGSSVRLQHNKDGSMGLMFICHTGLVDQFRDLYSDALAFEGNRAIVIKSDETLPEPELKHCIAMAFTYHMKRRSLAEG